MTDQLSEGVVTYLQARTAASPGADESAVLAVAGREDGAALSLGDAGREAAAETGKRHPGLSQEALDAIAWNVTFAWR